jgi:hypothetical protein
MEVNAGKCATASYSLDQLGDRCSVEISFQIRGQAIPNLSLAESLKYLDTAVAAKRMVKLHPVETRLTEMRIRLQTIMESPLLIVQEIDALKTFFLPMIDFMLLNGDVRRSQLTQMDQNIRAAVDRALKVDGLPIECHHASRRDGGLSYPSPVDRRRELMIRAFTHIMLSRDAKKPETIRWFAEEERELRGFDQDPNADFLDWGGDQQGRGTACLAARTRKACQEMKVMLKLQGDQMVIATAGSEQKVKSAVGIGHSLTQRVVRSEKFKKLIAKEVHGASYTTLQANEVSNLNLTDVYGDKSDAHFRFLVVGQADCLLTPANLGRCFGRPVQAESAAQAAGPIPNCPRCGADQRPTFTYLLNKCTLYAP